MFTKTVMFEYTIKINSIFFKEKISIEPKALLTINPIQSTYSANCFSFIIHLYIFTSDDNTSLQAYIQFCILSTLLLTPFLMFILSEM